MTNEAVLCYRNGYSDFWKLFHNDLIGGLRNGGSPECGEQVWRRALTELCTLVWGAFCLSVTLALLPFYVLGCLYAIFAACIGFDSEKVGDQILGITLQVPAEFAWEACKVLFFSNFAAAKIPAYEPFPPSVATLT